MPKSELPHDLDPDELNAMVRDLGREKGLPVGIHPDLIGPDEDNHDYWGYGQQERHKQSVEWRRKLIRELMRRPEWVAQWLADREMDRRVKELCEQKGLRFAPHECPPWWVRADEEPVPAGPFDGGWAASKPMAIRLRRQLEAEIRGGSLWR